MTVNDIATQLRLQIEQVISLRKMYKDIEAKKAKAEEALEEMMKMVEPTKATIVFEGWKLTRSPTISYSLSDEGHKKLTEYPYDTAYWNNTPNMACIREDSILKEYVLTKEGKTKIFLKENKESDE